MQDSSAEFWVECDEVMERISEGLHHLEKDQFNPGLIDSLYREVHTLKGTAQLFGIVKISQVAHTLESNLDLVRKNNQLLNAAVVEILYRGLELLERMIQFARGASYEFTEAQLAYELNLLIELSLDHIGGSMSSIKSSAPFAENIHAEKVQPAAELPLLQVTQQVTQQASKVSAPSVPAKPTESSQATGAAPSGDDSAQGDSSSTIRVPVGLLDKLMTLMGEMVLVRNQVLQFSNRSDDLGFLNLSQRLDVVTSELQSEMMKTRMQPLGNILNKFQRLVRDLSKELSKKIDLELSGTETELDKSLIEAVKDPLTHIIRNACDHGMELPAERLRAGKPETGHISVKSYHEGGQVIIEISDDGKGLHKDILLNRALEKGLITKEKAAAMTEREIFSIIFMPGFSTAAKVTNISGRGVGMDVVRQNIERIGGMVDLQSKQGEGTTIRLKIPLTLAIVPAMIIRSGEDRYAIPQVKLVELLRIDSTNSDNKIEMLQGQRVLRLRGDLLPLLNLAEFLAPEADQAQGREIPDVVNIVVLKAETQMFGLIVDEIQDTADIVVKPLNRFLKTLNIYSGATVLGDGSVALILDVMGISQRLQLTSENARDTSREKELSRQQRSIDSDMQEFLLLRTHASARHAIPLDLVHRLEEFKTSEVEWSGETRVMQYRDSILPIISVNEQLGYKASPDGAKKDSIAVIVTQRSGKYFGIEVNEILDVLKTAAVVDVGLSERHGHLGSMVAQDEVIVVVDVLAILEKFVQKSQPVKTEIIKNSVQRAKESMKILYAEDNAFFRRHVTGLLEREGFKVSTVNNGAEALDVLANSADRSFDIVISDIEMPVMGGLEFVKKARQNQKMQALPFIALSTKGSRSDIEEGLKSGFNLYLEKLNPSELLATLDQMNLRKAG